MLQLHINIPYTLSTHQKANYKLIKQIEKTVRIIKQNFVEWEHQNNEQDIIYIFSYIGNHTHCEFSIYRNCTIQLILFKWI